MPRLLNESVECVCETYTSDAVFRNAVIKNVERILEEYGVPGMLMLPFEDDESVGNKIEDIATYVSDKLFEINEFKTCAACKWYDKFSGVCVNSDSEHCADFQDEDGSCKCFSI